MASTTASAIAEAKRQIGKSDGRKANLYLAEHDGAVWATNRYWLTRVERIADLLGKFNIATDQIGSFEVGSTVRKMSDDAPNVGRMLSLSDYPDELRPLLVADRQVFYKEGDNFLALFEIPDGNRVGIRQDWLAWLSETASLGLYKDYGNYPGEVRYMYGKGRVAIVASVKAQRPGTGIYGDGKWIPAEFDDKGDEIISVVMPARA
jgi:hypothetical protein